MPRLIRPACCIALALALAAAAPARAQVATGTATWAAAGEVPPNWTDPTNWSTNPGGFYPNNGNGATNWDVSIGQSFLEVTLNANITVRQLTFTGTGTTIDGGTVGSPTNLTTTGTFAWTGGVLSGVGTVAANGGLALTTLTSAPATLSGRTLTLGAASTWTGSGGSWTFSNGGTLAVNQGVTFAIQNNRSIQAGTGGGQIMVNGTLRKDTATGSTGINVPVNVASGGLLTVQNGTISMGAGGTSAGDYSVAGGAGLGFDLGTFAVSGSITGASNSTLTVGGTVNLTGAYNAPGPVSVNSGGALNLQSGSSVTAIGTPTVGSGGSNATLSFSTGQAVSLPALNFNVGTLGGSDDVTVSNSGTLFWTSAALSGSGNVTVNGPLTLSSGPTAVDGKTLTVSGGLQWNSGNITLGNGAAIVVPTGATFTASSFSGTVSNGGGTAPRIDVNGTLTGGGVTINVPVNVAAAGQVSTTNSITFGDALNNSGTVKASGSQGVITITGTTSNSGTLSSEGFSSSAVNVNLAAGNTFTNTGTGTVQAHGGPLSFGAGGAGSSITNNGTFLADTGATLSVDGAATLTNFSVGTLTGGTYRVLADPQGTFGSTMDFGTRTVTTLGANTTVELNGANAAFTAVDSLTTNNGTLKVLNGRAYTFAGPSLTVGSTGTLSVGGGTTASTVAVPDAVNFTNFSGGTLTGGTYQVLDNGTLDLGTRTVTTIGTGTTVELNGAGSNSTALNSVTTNNGTFKILGGRTFTPNGGTLNNAGTLVVGQTAGDGSTLNGSVALSGSGTIGGTGAITGGVSVGSGSKLGGSTTVSGSVTVGAGGTVAPGNSPGILTVGGVTFTGGTLAVELNGTTPGTQYDRLASTAGVALGNGVTTLTTSLGYAPSAGDTLTIVTAGSPVTGTFAGLPDGQTFPVGSFGGVPYTATILYNPSGNNSVALTNFTPVPEPAAALAVCLAGVAAAARLRRRR